MDTDFSSIIKSFDAIGVAAVVGIALAILWVIYSLAHYALRLRVPRWKLLLQCAIGLVAIIVIPFAVPFLIFWLTHYVLTLPMRRAERARLFLDQVEFAIKQGRPIEETLISLAQSRDLTMGVHFHLLVARLEQGMTLEDALAKTPRFLPPQITAMLLAGRKIGDLRKVLPACRQFLKDAVSQTRSALNYLVTLTFVLTPLAMWVVFVLQIVVLPKFKEIAEGILFDGGGGGGLLSAFNFINAYEWVMIDIQVVLLLLTWLAAFAYIGGPRFAGWFPIVQRVQYWLPWRRKRLQRDFSTMLAILLDCGVPEPEALALAADCTANSVFRKRAQRAVADLRRGVKLTEAVQAMDDSGEFGWRLTNANHGSGGFLKALAGWHESLEAKAFQQEQAAAHGITTGLVLWSGVFIGAVVISVFSVLVAFTNAGVLW